MTGGAIASQVYVYSVPKSGYAPNGNLLAYEDSVMGSWKFYYDTLNRLTGGTSISGPYAGYTNCLAYDPYGNRIEYLFQANNTNCPTAPLSSTQQTATYSANNQLTSIAETMPIVNNAGTGLNEVTASGNPTYDASGNVTNDGVNSYAYDGEGRLCAVKNDVVGGTPHEYLYDATGMRVAVGTLNAWPPYCITPPSNAAGNSFTVMINGISYTFTLVKQYLLDKNGNQATELDGSGNWVHSNVWIGGHTLATYDARGLHFHLTDPLGSRRVQMSSAGVVEEYCWSLPFGESLSCVQTGLSSANDATEHHFTGKERDTESGLDYFGARYYASTMGRFLSPDPSGLEYADPTTPQSLNLYAYVRNNPLNNIDPSGMECVWDDGSYDAADDPDTGEGNNGSGKSAADKCGRQGGTWEDPTWFEDMEGTQYGDWSGEASSQVQFDMLTPSINANTPNNAPTLDQINSMIIAGSLNDFFKWLSCNGKQNCYQGAQYPLSAPEAWLPKNNYCGRNGAGNPVSRNDWACAVHDYNYRQIGGSGKGYSFWSNPSPKVAMQLRQADRILFENTSGFEGAVIGGVELTAVPFTAFYSLTH
jgi:RHS repeat-associated protein